MEGKERDSVIDYGESSEEIDEIGVSLDTHKFVNIYLLESGRRPTYTISGECKIYPTYQEYQGNVYVKVYLYKSFIIILASCSLVCLD